MKTVIELDGVSKTYDMDSVKVEALRHTDLKIKEREFVSIMGASGSGKSTLLHLIGVLDRPTKGHVSIAGRNISTLGKDQLARIRGEKIGFVFQSFNLYPTLTAKENVELPMLIHEVESSERGKKSAALLKKVGLGSRMDHYPAQMSGGERQRVAIARALANDPELILADEPTGNLDSTTGIEIMHLFVELNREGKTIVMVTHEKNIANFSKRVITVKDGRIIGDERK